MTKPLIRFARRLANWEQDLPVAELQKREFKAKDGGPDLRLSVYEVDAEQPALVRTYAEHAHEIDPPRTALAVDASGLNRPVEAMPGKREFAFIRDRHRELVLRDEADLHDLIRCLTADLPARRHEVSKKEVIEYVRERVEQGDPEWIAAADAPGAKSWLRDLRKK
ncbi:MAG TPA: hypothetical protein VLS89_05630 [Candidatus Nanopelagicales bacterium]|nr:hypothetical protein [Candidatus Nanopelagicales bacterium]